MILEYIDDLKSKNMRDGVVVQNDGDSGDTAQRCGTVVSLIKLMGFDPDSFGISYQKMISQLKVGHGRYRRSPFDGWYSDPTNLSRDQLSILMLAMALVGDKKELKEASKEIAMRGGFMQNMLRGADDPERRWKCPDFMTPGLLAVIIRGLDAWYLYPILCILDVFYMFDLIFRKYHLWDADNMLAQNLWYARSKYPTPAIYITLKLYVKTDYLEQLKHYHAEGNGVPAIYEMFLDVHQKLSIKYGLA